LNKVTFKINPVPPFSLEYTAWALRRMPNNEIDRWDGETYRRLVDNNGTGIAIAVKQSGTVETPVLEVTATGEAAEPELRNFTISTLKYLLGTDIDLSDFYRMADGDPALAELVKRFRGVKSPRFPTIFEAVVNGISCQQISLNVCISLMNRLGKSYGLKYDKGDLQLHAFPGPQALHSTTPEAIRELGYSWNKVRAITELVAAISNGLDLESIREMNDSNALAFLRKRRGVGGWTADYALLRGLGRINIFPGGDVGAQNRLRTWLGLRDKLNTDSARLIANRWEPYGGMVYFHLLLIHLVEKGYLDER
jgi:DNA-3-methyladenine glycosylase II